MSLPSLCRKVKADRHFTGSFRPLVLSEAIDRWAIIWGYKGVTGHLLASMSARGVYLFFLLLLLFPAPVCHFSCHLCSSRERGQIGRVQKGG